MTENEKREAARQFYYKWNGKGKEDEDDRSFWFDLLNDVMGVEHVTDYVDFQKKVVVPEDGKENTKRIDAYIQETKVIIEQKSLGISLSKPGHQSGGIMLTPYEQAKRYNDNLPYDEKARWIVTSNFAEIWIYDMNQRVPAPQKIEIENLQSEYKYLDFLVKADVREVSKEEAVSKEAGEIVGEIYDAFLKQYADPENLESQKSLNKLCVRLVFLLYAEDSGLLGGHQMFHDYMKDFPAKEWRGKLIELFKILNTDDRSDPYMDHSLKAFPYVNGGLFADENIEIPIINDEIVDLIINRASGGFDWSQISPTIFGAVFESTLNPETRRSGGMHYTSPENIHKVIDPLFLEELSEELEQIKSEPVLKAKERKLHQFQDKLSGLKFLDPACGSGNFLTETFLSLRRLENDVLATLSHGQIMVANMMTSPIKVNINQFYGIEINDFAVTVAKTALWIAEHQMIRETEDIIRMQIEFLPLHTEAKVVEGNALRINWEDVIPKSELNFIMGNPPFVGYSLQNQEQKKDIMSIYTDEDGKVYSTAGEIDYVAGWFFKAAQFIHHTNISVALVSTNSITQGEQVSSIWKPIFERFGITIRFAHRTFIWDSEASIKAKVHCVIVGFASHGSRKEKYIYQDGQKNIVNNINAYLLEAPDIFVDSRSKPLCKVSAMVNGNKPADGGSLFLTKEEKEDVLRAEPDIEKYIKRVYGAVEYINNKERYCFWLKGVSPDVIRKSAIISDRVSSVKSFRLASPKEATKKSAEIPFLFQQIRQPESNYIIVPRVSSQNRRYVPVGFMDPEIIVTDSVQFIPNASIYEFGIITSNVHMAWMRAICGRLKSDYRYSAKIVYNNFPWPEVTDEQMKLIEEAAKGILDARALYPDSSLADLYDELTMPPELRKAHRENDVAVMKAYRMDIKNMTESDCVAQLMEMYQRLIKQ